MSTLLMDDSPRKAEVQPYNHLCVKEYSNVIRNRDLTSLLEEKARAKSPSPPPSEEPESQPLHPPMSQLPLGISHSLVSSTIHHQHPTPFNLPPVPLEPPSDFQFDQSVGIQPGATLLNPLPLTSNTGAYPRLPGDSSLGHGVIAPQMLFKNPSPSMAGYQNPQPFQQLPQSITPFTPQQMHHPKSYLHPSLTEAPVQPAPLIKGNTLPLLETAADEVKPPPDPAPSTSTSKKRKRKQKQEAVRKASGSKPISEIEYDETLLAIVGILDEVKHQSNVASWVKANGLWGPYPPQNLTNPNTDALTRDHFRNSHEDIATLSDSGSVDSGRREERKKKRRDAVTAFFETSVMEGPEDGDLPCAPTNEKSEQPNTSETPMWFDDPLTMRYWVERGRDALETLGIPVEHGLKQ